MFSAPGMEETYETEDGEYGGSRGKFDAREYGGRVAGQLMFASFFGWQVAAIGRVNGVLQSMPGESHSGMSGEVGLQSELSPDSGKAFMIWCWLGPYGRGAGLNFNRQGTVGGSVTWMRPESLSGYGLGVGIGGEARLLGERLFHSSVGAVIQAGSPAKAGPTFFCRIGVKEADETALFWQPHAGMGVLWKRRSGLGVQLDYAIAPLGDLGNCHYATLTVRPGPALPKREWDR
jgi:hypothetical protein